MLAMHCVKVANKCSQLHLKLAAYCLGYKRLPTGLSDHVAAAITTITWQDSAKLIVCNKPTRANWIKHLTKQTVII